MGEIKIKSIPQELIDKIDSLAAQSKCTDRSAFLVAALKDYCLYHDRYFLHSLPDTTRILAEDVVEKSSKQSDDLLQYAIKTIQDNNSVLKQLNEIFNGVESGEDLDNEDN